MSAMTHKRALKLALESMKKEVQSLAVQANLFVTLGMPSGGTAHRRREALREAIALLEEEKAGCTDKSEKDR